MISCSNCSHGAAAIVTSLNFEFLRAYDEQLAVLDGFAESYFRTGSFRSNARDEDAMFKKSLVERARQTSQEIAENDGDNNESGVEE
ncbi:hypothetical protein [Rhizobium jaguaris]|uniref:Uncharacterized protein n=1 Tax=Rhizobium jaguaris TaxID=1312183 RepID=A0A387FSM3_9HYPH|nr:hypothetical protein [Rhizobium jaguaris]AYG60435.1 hypothetical protein CCGE525_17685 [Rhizobium jaguaris]